MSYKNYIPCLEFVASHSECSIKLSEHAFAIITKSTLPDLPKDCLDISFEQGVLSSNKEFSNPDYLAFFYSVYYLENILKPVEYNNWFDILDKLNSPLHRSFRQNIGHNYFSIILLIINQLKGIQLTTQIIESEEIPNYIKTILFPILPGIKCIRTDLLKMILKITDGIKPEDNYLDLNQSIYTLALQDHDFLKELIDYTERLPEKMFLLIPFAFMGFCETHGLKKSYEIIKSLLHSEDNNKQRVAIRSFSTLKNLDQEAIDTIRNLLPLFDQILKKSEPTLSSEILWIYYNQKENFPDLLPQIIDGCIGRNNSQINHVLSRLICMELFAPSHDLTWIKKGLLSLTVIDTEHLATFSNIESALTKLLQWDKEIIYNYLNLFIENENNDIKNINGFKDVFTKLYSSDRVTLQKWITLWLNNDNIRFHVAVLYVCSNLWVNDYKDIQLDKTVLDSLEPSDIEFILYKIAGWIQSKEHLESLIFSALRYKKIDKNIQNLIVELFCNHILYNYPMTSNYLSEKKPKATKFEKAVIDEILEFHRERSNIKIEKPNELKPSFKRLDSIFQKEALESLNAKDDNKFKDPSFINMFPKVTLKFKGSYFMRNEEYGVTSRYTEKFKLNYIEQSFEFPSGVFIDPVGQHYQQLQWRKFKRKVK